MDNKSNPSKATKKINCPPMELIIEGNEAGFNSATEEKTFGQIFPIFAVAKP